MNKSEIRIPKSEGSPNTEIRVALREFRGPVGFRISDFGFPHSEDSPFADATPFVGGGNFTCDASASRIWPSVTTVSPDRTPLWITIQPVLETPSVTGLFSTVESDLTTKTKSPLWLDCTAWEGTTVALSSMLSLSTARTN